MKAHFRVAELIFFLLCSLCCINLLFSWHFGDIFCYRTSWLGLDVWLSDKNSLSFRSHICCDFWKQPNEENLGDSLGLEAYSEREGTFSYIGKPMREVKKKSL